MVADCSCLGLAFVARGVRAVRKPKLLFGRRTRVRGSRSSSRCPSQEARRPRASLTEAAERTVFASRSCNAVGVATSRPSRGAREQGSKRNVAPRRLRGSHAEQHVRVPQGGTGHRSLLHAPWPWPKPTCHDASPWPSAHPHESCHHACAAGGGTTRTLNTAYRPLGRIRHPNCGWLAGCCCCTAKGAATIRRGDGLEMGQKGSGPIVLNLSPHDRAWTPYWASLLPH